MPCHASPPPTPHPPTTWHSPLQIFHYPVNHSPARAAARDLLSQLTGRPFTGRAFNACEVLAYFGATLGTALVRLVLCFPRTAVILFVAPLRVPVCARAGSGAPRWHEHAVLHMPVTLNNPNAVHARPPARLSHAAPTLPTPLQLVSDLGQVFKLIGGL